ncbi:MAG: DUF1015 domain-containing protein [Fimbriimonas sp.]
MAVLRPFQGLRFSSSLGPLEDLVAPPYDVLTPAQRDEFAAKSAHNTVWLTLPEQEPGDRSKYIKYARSAARLAEWRRDGALQLEAQPALYRYIQTFHIPGTPEALVRTSFIALLKTEPYANGVVLPHEQTFPKHKEDRLRILEATRAHLECIFGLYEDPDSAVLNTLLAAPSSDRVEVFADGVHHVLEPIVDESAIAALLAGLSDKKVWIADGHHRYETACAFREALGPREELVAEDFLMMAFSSMADPGLVLLPTHRVLAKLPFTEDELRERLAAQFDLHETPNSDLMARIEALGIHAFGVALPGANGFVITPKSVDALLALVPGDASAELKALDVTLLHSVILENLLGIEGYDLISYTRDAEEAVHHQGAVAFLMNPPSVDDMRVIALGGEKMPQKSTYYYPKVLSGLAIWSLGDF